jgi:hypothetical protein
MDEELRCAKQRGLFRNVVASVGENLGGAWECWQVSVGAVQDSTATRTRRPRLSNQAIKTLYCLIR